VANLRATGAGGARSVVNFYFDLPRQERSRSPRALLSRRKDAAGGMEVTDRFVAWGRTLGRRLGNNDDALFFAQSRG